MSEIKTKYQPTGGFDYNNGSISAGLCKDSKHRVNDYYCKVNNMLFELRIDEVYAILQTLSTALWVKGMYERNPKMRCKKWKSRKDL